MWTSYGESDEHHDLEKPEQRSDEQTHEEAALKQTLTDRQQVRDRHRNAPASCARRPAVTHTCSKALMEDPMACERCGGMSIAAHFEGDRAWEYDGWKCLICGNITDPLIITNRNAQAHGAIGPMSSKGMRPVGGAVSPSRHTGTARS